MYSKYESTGRQFGILGDMNCPSHVFVLCVRVAYSYDFFCWIGTASHQGRSVTMRCDTIVNMFI